VIEQFWWAPGICPGQTKTFLVSQPGVEPGIFCESGQTEAKGIREAVHSLSLEILNTLLDMAKDNLLS